MSIKPAALSAALLLAFSGVAVAQDALTSNPFAGFRATVGVAATSSFYDIGIDTTISGVSNSLNMPDLGGQGLGLLGGIGYDYAVSDQFIVGVFADVTQNTASNDYAGRTTAPRAPARRATVSRTSYTLTQDYSASVGLRAGMRTSDNTMIYGLVGKTMSRFTGQAAYRIGTGPTPDSDRSNYDFYNRGNTFGVGIETMVAANLSASIEYRYTGYKTYDLFELGDYGNPSSTGMRGSADHSAQVVSVGLNYRF